MNAANQAKLAINTYYLSLGSNIEPKLNLPKAVSFLGEHGTIAQVSSAWRSAAVESEGPVFLNCAVRFETSQHRSELKLKVLRLIETQMGRIRSENKNAPRPIDIDILIENKTEVDPALWEYAHLAVPLAEIFANYTHPISGISILETSKLLQKSNGIIKDNSVQFL